MWENTDQKISEYGHFSRSDIVSQQRQIGDFVIIALFWTSIAQNQYQQKRLLKCMFKLSETNTGTR